MLLFLVGFAQVLFRVVVVGSVSMVEREDDGFRFID